MSVHCKRITGSHLGTGGGPDCKCEQLGVVAGALEADLCKAGGVALYRLGHSALLRVELHRSLDLEAGRVGRVGADADEDEPLFVGRDAVVDDLVPGERGVAIKHLDGRV